MHKSLLIFPEIGQIVLFFFSYNEGLCLHPVNGVLLSYFIQHYYGCDGFFGEFIGENICYIFPLCMESNVLEESTNNNVASRFLARSPSKIRQIFEILYAMDRFL